MKYKFLYKLTYLVVIVSWLVYAYFTFTAPISSGSQAIGLSGSVLFYIRLTIALPYLFIWLLAVYGWSHISNYSKGIKDSKDGHAFSHISTGLLWLIIGLVSSALVSSWRSMGINDPIHMLSATIVTNYLYVFLPLVGFAFIYKGAYALKAVLPVSIPRFSLSTKVFTITFIVAVSVLFKWLVFTNPNRQIMPLVDTAATYYLSDPFIVLTIFIPLVIAWVLGVLSMLYILYYQRYIQGEIYKNALSKLSYGIIAIVFGSIVLQFILALGSDRLLGIGLGPLLIIIYVFLIVQAVGYIFVALGAKKLKSLEEVEI